MRIVCIISWVFAIPMFLVPEPVRNETNRMEAEKKAQEEAKKAEE